jgi:catechol 2,3-dioxygenase-like lactoylglutathione lyase family enzyme
MAKLRHIAFMVNEPQRLFDFYHNVLGVEQVRVSPSGSIHVVDPYFNMALLQIEGGELEVVGTHRSDGSEADQRQGINHFGFVVDKLDDVLQKLPEGIRFGESPQNGRPAELRIIDPWGNNFDLSSRGFLGQEERRLPGVRHVVVHNDHPSDVAEFYTSVLDLREIRRTADGTITLSDGDVTLALTPEQVLPKSGIQYFGVRMPNWGVAQERFRTVGVDLPMPQGLDDEVRVTDPEGNIFVLSAEGWGA